MNTQGYTTDDTYRVMSRNTAAALVVLVIGVGALGVWFGLRWVDLYSSQMSELIASSPEQAHDKLISDLKVVALTTVTITSALAAFLFLYALKSLRTQSMPPRDSWVIEGQRIRVGPEAVYFAKLLLVVSAIVLLLGILAAAALWQVPVALLASQ